jgi:hypothetical protein
MSIDNSLTTSSPEYFPYLNRLSQQFKTEGRLYKDIPLDEVVVAGYHTHGSISLTINDMVGAYYKRCGSQIDGRHVDCNWLFVSPREEKYRKELEEAKKELEELKKQRDDAIKESEEAKKEKNILNEELKSVKEQIISKSDKKCFIQ